MCFHRARNCTSPIALVITVEHVLQAGGDGGSGNERKAGAALRRCLASWRGPVLPRAGSPREFSVRVVPQAWTTGFALLINKSFNHCDFHRDPGIIGVGVREWEDETKKSLFLTILKVI